MCLLQAHYLSYMRSQQTNTLNTPSFSLPSSHTPRRQVRRLPEEEICLQTSLHLSSWQRYRLWPPGGSQLAVQRTVLREADCEFRKRQKRHVTMYHNWAMTPVDKNNLQCFKHTLITFFRPIWRLPDVAVPCRNQRLFHHVFRLHRCVLGAVSLNFH